MTDTGWVVTETDLELGDGRTLHVYDTCGDGTEGRLGEDRDRHRLFDPRQARRLPAQEWPRVGFEGDR